MEIQFPLDRCTCRRCPHCGGRLPGAPYVTQPYVGTPISPWTNYVQDITVGQIPQYNGSNHPEPLKSAYLTGLAIAKGQ